MIGIKKGISDNYEEFENEIIDTDFNSKQNYEILVNSSNYEYVILILEHLVNHIHQEFLNP